MTDLQDGVTGEALDDIVTGAADGILDIAGIKMNT